MNKLIDFLRGLQQSGFYGTVQVQFQAGDIKIIRKEETFTVSTLGETQNARVK